MKKLADRKLTGENTSDSILKICGLAISRLIKSWRCPSLYNTVTIICRELYPGYVMRLYYEVGPHTLEQLCQLACEDTLLDLCPAQFNPR
jgi:hypothetical protein